MKFEFPSEIYQDELGNEVFDVKVGNEILKGLKAAKRSSFKCRNCDYSGNCEKERVFRKYDCQRKVEKLQNSYKSFTASIVTVWAYFVFSYFEFHICYKMALLVLSLTGLDIVCTLVEESVPKIYNWRFCQKLRKLLKIQKKKKDAEEAKLKAEEEARIRDIPGYLGVKKARAIIQKFNEISKQYDYGPNTFNINSCVENCEVIMKILEKDSSSYYRVSDVFEQYLPSVCTTIELHQKFVETKTITEEQKLLFEQFIEAVAAFLNKKKDDVIYYNNVDEINLKSATNNLRNAMQEEN